MGNGRWAGLAGFYSRVGSDAIDFRFRFLAESPSLLSVAHTVSAECVMSLSVYFQLVCKTICLVLYKYICYCPSVCLSVHQAGGSVKNSKVKIMQLSLYSSDIPLVLGDKFHPETLMGSLQVGVTNKGRIRKVSYFLALRVSVSKMV